VILRRKDQLPTVAYDEPADLSAENRNLRALAKTDAALASMPDRRVQDLLLDIRLALTGRTP
jgi:hypothetical protein